MVLDGCAEDDRIDMLLACMTGSAKGPVEAELSQNPNISFTQLIWNLDRRFERRGSPQDTIRRFFESKQQSSESLDEWADRVSVLGTQANFSVNGEPETIQTQFCGGLLDLDAGRSIEQLVHTHKDLRQTVEAVRKYQRTKGGAVADARRRPHIGEVGSLDDYLEEDFDICAVQQGRSPWRRGPPQRQGGQPQQENRPTASEPRAITDIEQILKDLTATIIVQMKELMAQTQQDGRRRGPRGNCFNCNQPGHFQAECPLPRKPDGNNLNGTRAEPECQTAPRPEK